MLLATAKRRTAQVRATSRALSSIAVFLRMNAIGSGSSSATAARWTIAGDLVPVADGAKGVEVGQLRLLDRHAPLEEGRRRRLAVPGDDDLLAQVGERERRVGADRAEPAGDEDHRVTGCRRGRSASGSGSPSAATQVGRTAMRAMRVPGWSIWAR